MLFVMNSHSVSDISLKADCVHAIYDMLPISQESISLLVDLVSLCGVTSTYTEILL
jgi:hypothetical protein